MGREQKKGSKMMNVNPALFCWNEEQKIKLYKITFENIVLIGMIHLT
ncbi:hypothetical protein [Bacillus thuringiensis]|nr:hypothetical protein [Bacillus thuringiensis]MED2019440.1 hypothetical protein [Bacillus thuringiensis]HDR5272529.1 hypothetical protein [Bacillus thuringiensis]